MGPVWNIKAFLMKANRVCAETKKGRRGQRGDAQQERKRRQGMAGREKRNEKLLPLYAGASRIILRNAKEKITIT